MGSAHTVPLHALASCTRLPCPPGHHVDAFGLGDLNPLKWLGKGASIALGDVWKAAMTALWSAGLWILDLAFKIIDAFTTPDLSANGPLADVLPYTFALGLMVATLMAFIQIGIALYQRDGKSIARVMVGVIQFGAVWIGYIAIAATLVTAAAGLTKGLLQGLLHIDAFSGFSNSGSWPRQVDDTVVATVLGLCTVFLIFPAAIGYVLIMLVREAALMLLTATSPIAAGGLLSEGTRSWFWKTLRWFIASLMISPLCALILGIGVKITHATVEGKGDKTAAAVGMAVVGCVLILIGAICPLILFRLLAFVDPGTSSGATMRQSLAANGGMAGLLAGKGSGSTGSSTAGSGAATKNDGQGRSQGESSADSATQSRFSSMMGPLGQAMQTGANTLSSVGSKAASIGADVLGSTGVGHQAPYFGQGDYYDTRSGSPNGGGSGAGHSVPGSGSEGQTPGDAGGGAAGGGEPPTPPTPQPPSPQPPAPPTPAAGGGGGGGSAGSGTAAAAEVPVVPV